MSRNLQDLRRLLDHLAGCAGRVEELQSRLTAFRALGPENGGQGEWEKTEFVARVLADAKVTDMRRFDAPDERVSRGFRPNLVARVPGRDSRTLRLFAHTDVVPPGPEEDWTSDPWTARREGDLLFGRGVEDNQQGLVSMILLAEALAATDVTPELSLDLVFMADEETGNRRGLAHLLSAAPEIFRPGDLHVIPDAGSPDGADVEIAEKAILHFRVTVRGLQGHASTPQRARNAFTAASEAALTLDALHEAFPDRDELFDPPCSTFTPTKHLGNGGGVNVIPGSAVFFTDCRLLPSVDPDAVLEAARRLLRPVAERRGAEILVEEEFLQTASATPADADVVLALKPAIRAVYGVEPRPVGIGGGTVAALLRHAGLPAAVWSRIDGTCHQIDEHSSISATIGDARVFAHALMRA